MDFKHESKVRNSSRTHHSYGRVWECKKLDETGVMLMEWGAKVILVLVTGLFRWSFFSEKKDAKSSQASWVLFSDRLEFDL